MTLPAKSTETLTHDALFAGDKPPVTVQVTILTGENLLRGAILGRITASGKFVLSLSAAGDGSEVPIAVLAQDTDATAADVDAAVYLEGEFDETKCTIGAAHTADSIRWGLSARGIHLKKNVPV